MQCDSCEYKNNCDKRTRIPELKACPTGNPHSRTTKKTNGDHIRAMSDEELAKFLDNYRAETIGNEWCLHLCPQRLAGAEECDCPYEGYETALGWLKSEVKEHG